MASKVNSKYASIILCAGDGSRLGIKSSLTSKVLLPIFKNKNSLTYNLNILIKAKIKKIYINSYKFYKQIYNFLKKKKFKNLDINLIYEKKLLGTAGAVANIKKYLKNYNSVIVLYGDNISRINLNRIIKFHEKNNSDFTIAINKMKDFKKSGVVTMDKQNNLTSFVEKKNITAITDNWVNSGIYIIKKKIFKKIKKDKKDFATDLIPYLLSAKIKIKVIKTKSKVFTIDNPYLLSRTRRKINF